MRSPILLAAAALVLAGGSAIAAGAGATGATGSDGAPAPTGQASAGLINDGLVIRSAQRDAVARTAEGRCVSRWHATFGQPVPCPLSSGRVEVTRAVGDPAPTLAQSGRR